MHSRGFEFFKEILQPEIVDDILSIGDPENCIQIGQIKVQYNEKSPRGKPKSPDNEIIFSFNVYELLNFLLDKNVDELEEQNGIEYIKYDTIEISLIVELEATGISGAQNDIDQYKKRQNKFSMLKLPFVILNKNINSKSSNLIEKDNIALKLYQTSKYKEYC